jgi:hypothetical protein
MIGDDETGSLRRRGAFGANIQPEQMCEGPTEGDRKPAAQWPAPSQRDPLQRRKTQEHEHGEKDCRGAKISHDSPQVGVAIRPLLKSIACSSMTTRHMFFRGELSPNRHQIFASGF